MDVPEIHCARSGDVAIAYQVAARGDSTSSSFLRRKPRLSLAESRLEILRRTPRSSLAMSVTGGAQPDTMVLGGDLEVRREGFGALHLAGPGSWGEPRDRERAKAVLRRAVALGVNLIDTADSYGPEVSEFLIAEALYPYPDGLVIATKGGKIRTGPSTGIWPPDGRPEHLRVACEGV